MNLKREKLVCDTCGNEFTTANTEGIYTKHYACGETAYFCDTCATAEIDRLTNVTFEIMGKDKGADGCDRLLATMKMPDGTTKEIMYETDETTTVAHYVDLPDAALGKLRAAHVAYYNK